jgi:hypothetical protein
MLREAVHIALLNIVKDNGVLSHALEAHGVVKCRGSHILKTIGPQMAVRLPALLAGCVLLPTNIF